MPEVSQRFIDLLNVPLDVLRDIAKDKKIAGAASMTKWPLAQALDSLPRSDLEALTGGFLYAGRTSVTFFRLDEPPKKRDAAASPDEFEVPAADAAEIAAAHEDQPAEADAASEARVRLEGQPVDPLKTEIALRALTPGSDPFNEASRPESTTREPQLVVARKRDDGSILMTFVTEGAIAHVIHNFTIEPVIGDDFFSAVLYPDSGLVEVRTNQQNAARFGRSWLNRFAEELGLAPMSVTISPGDFTALADELEAGTTRFRGKNTSGGAVDTIELRMAPGHATLRGDDFFEDRVAGTEQQLGDLVFEWKGKPYRIRVSRIRGSIYFVTPAPEGVIDYVREALRRVKVRHRNTN